MLFISIREKLAFKNILQKTSLSTGEIGFYTNSATSLYNTLFAELRKQAFKGVE